MPHQENKDESVNQRDGSINQSVRLTAELGARTIILMVGFALIMAANGYVMGLTMAKSDSETKAFESQRRQGERDFIVFTELKAKIEAKEKVDGRTSVPR
jgi:hypothetical protein